MHRRTAAAALLALGSAAVRAQESPVPSGAGTSATVAGLADLVRETNPFDLAPLVRSDPRFAALTPGQRRALLDAVAEPPRIWAAALNLYPGFAIGSFASGDQRGVWTAGGEAAGAAGLMVAAMVGLGDSFYETPAQADRRRRTAATIGVASLGLFAVSRAISVALPFSFHGRHHAVLERELPEAAEAPARPAVAWVAPLATDGDRRLGIAAGVATAF